jgi:hypothetical protein
MNLILPLPSLHADFALTERDEDLPTPMGGLGSFILFNAEVLKRRVRVLNPIPRNPAVAIEAGGAF